MEGKEMVKSPFLEEPPDMSLPRHTERSLDPHVAQWVVRAVTQCFAIYAILIGLAIIIGGAPRFGGVSYTVALELPGAPASWGILIAAAGVVTLLGTLMAKPGMVGIGMIAAALWSLMLASAFAIATWKYPDASSTAMWVYLFVAAILFLLGSAHLSMAKWASAVIAKLRLAKRTDEQA
jgi:hypothetical protein